MTAATLIWVMPKKPPAPRRTHVKEAHLVLQDALLKVGAAADRSKGAQQKAHAEVAKKLGVSTSMLYKWREPAEKGSGHPNPLERTAILIEATGDTRIADWIAQRAGGQFTVDDPASPPAGLDKAANALVREFGLLIAEVVDAIEDHRITPDESQSLREKWNGLRKRAETFVRTCEKGDYGPKA
ncbi:MAG: phage regulatory CII family protein [Verrucomicrobiota bacterium]|jgi:transposase